MNIHFMKKKCTNGSQQYQETGNYDRKYVLRRHLRKYVFIVYKTSNPKNSRPLITKHF